MHLILTLDSNDVNVIKNKTSVIEGSHGPLWVEEILSCLGLVKPFHLKINKIHDNPVTSKAAFSAPQKVLL